MSEFAAPERIEESAKRRRGNPPKKRDRTPPDSERPDIKESGSNRAPIKSVGMPVDVVNARIARIDESHRKRYGFPASPGLAYDLVRAPASEEDLDDPFGGLPQGRGAKKLTGPRNPIEAGTQADIAPSFNYERVGPNIADPAAVLANRQASDAGLNEMERVLGEYRVSREFAEQIQNSMEAQRGKFYTSRELSEMILNRESRERDLIALIKDRGTERASTLLEDVAANAVDANQVLAAADSLGVDIGRLDNQLVQDVIDADDPDTVATLLGLTGEEVLLEPGDVTSLGFGSGVFSSQPTSIMSRLVRGVFESIIYTPAGIAMMAKAVGHDTFDFMRGDFTPSRTATLGREVAELSWQALNNPSEYPADALFTIAAFASAGAGAAARAGAVGRATSTARASGASKAAVAKEGARALITRPQAGYIELGGSIINLSETAWLRGLQRAYYAGVQNKQGVALKHRMDRSFRANDPQLTAAGALIMAAANPRKTARKVRANAQRVATVTHHAAMLPVTRLVMSMHATDRSGRVFTKMLEDPRAKALLEGVEGLVVAVTVEIRSCDLVGRWARRDHSLYPTQAISGDILPPSNLLRAVGSGHHVDIPIPVEIRRKRRIDPVEAVLDKVSPPRRPEPIHVLPPADLVLACSGSDEIEILVAVDVGDMDRVRAGELVITDRDPRPL